MLEIYTSTTHATLMLINNQLYSPINVADEQNKKETALHILETIRLVIIRPINAISSCTINERIYILFYITMSFHTGTAQ